MTHVDELLARAHDSDLNYVERRNVSAHLAECARCRALAQELERNDRLIATREEVHRVARFDTATSRGHARLPGVAIATAAIALVAFLIARPGPPNVAAPGTPAPSPPAQATATPQAGSITGLLGYPAEAVPAVTVYAISTSDPRTWYSVDVPRTPAPPPRYTITGVAPGIYHVIAYRNDGQGPDPGAYTQAVAGCRGPQTGSPAPACKDHSLVPVTVLAGQTVSNIDVTDWAVGFEQPSPTIPPRPTPR